MNNAIEFEGVLKKSRAETYYIERNGQKVAKECTGCGEVKELNSFYKQELGIAGRRSKCKVCLTVQKKRYRDGNREKIVEYGHKYRHGNKEKIARYYKNNRVMYSVNHHRWRARERGLPDNLTVEQYHEILSHFDCECALTGKEVDLQIDHVLPIAIGHGGTIIANMIPLNNELNHSKRNENIFEWFSVNKQRFNLSQSKFDSLIEYLSTINGMTKAEYRNYVYQCHDNPREL